MRRFIKTVIVFMLPVLLVAGIMEYALRQIPNEFAVKSQYLENNADSIETLILGSSHVLYGINPHYLSQKALNFGNVSQTIDLDKRLLEDINPLLPQLKNVIIRLSYTTLYEQLNNSKESWRLKNYNIYTPFLIDNNIKYHFEILSVKLKINIGRINDYFINDNFELNTSLSGWGTDANSKDSKDLEISGQSIASKHTIEDQSLFSENVNYLTQIVEYCDKHNIEIIILTTPTHKNYYSNLEDNQIQSTIDLGKELEAKYNNCRYFNLLNSSKFTDTDFFDADHLNENGAKKLTEFLDNEIKNLNK